MDKTGDPFYLIIDEVVQNIIPNYQLKVVGLPASYHEIKLLYTNGVIIQVKEHVTLQQHKQYTGFVNWIGGNKKLNWIEVVNINQSMYGQNVLVVQYAGKNTNTCHLCTGVNPPGQHYHPDGTIHNNYTGNRSEERSEERRVGKECRSRM